jgi:hypothetical protein
MRNYSFWLLGSGRWAKIIATQLLVAFGENTSIHVVTKRDAEKINKEFLNEGVNVLSVVDDIPPNLEAASNFAIVCGKTLSNVKSARKSLSLGLNVYVEKPFSLRSSELHLLTLEANSKNLQIYTSNVFYFQEQIYNLLFFERDKPTGPVCERLKFNWVDKCDKKSYSLGKKYNASLTVFEDILPHLLPIAYKLLDVEQINLESVSVKRMGQAVKLLFCAKNCEIEINMERNGEERSRLLEITHNKKTSFYDFSGRVGSGSYINNYMRCSDFEIPGPLSLSLFDFVRSSSSSEINPYSNLIYSTLTLEMFQKLRRDTSSKSVY